MTIAEEHVSRARELVLQAGRVRKISLMGYVVAVPFLWLAAVPVPPMVGGVLVFWLATSFLFEFFLKRARTEGRVHNLHGSFMLLELGFMLYAVHRVGTVAWVGVFFPVFTLYYACTLLPRAWAATITLGAMGGFTALAMLEAYGILPHQALMVRSPDNYRDMEYVIPTLLLTAVGGYALLGSTFERFGRLQREEIRASERRRTHAEALAAATEALGAGTDQTAILRAITRSAVVAVDANRASIWLTDETNGVTRRMVQMTRDGPVQVGPEVLPLSHPLVNNILTNGGIVIGSDQPDSPTHELASAVGAKALLIVPFNREGTIGGALSLTDTRPRVWSAEEIDTLTALAVQGALAVERARMANAEAEASALRQVNQMRDDFFREIGHELRTPLTLVNGYLELLAERPDRFSPERQASVLAELRSNTRDMMALLDDLSDLARAEAGQLRLDRRPTNLLPLLQAQAEGFRGLPGGERITTSFPEALPDVEVDPVRIRQVVGNLITNALRYAPEGPIQLVADEANGEIVISVVDRGPGIAAEHQVNVFERYFRAQAAGDSVVGTGIGLALVKTLTEAHGGRVSLRSEAGEGCDFTLSLPVTAGSNAVLTK